MGIEVHTLMHQALVDAVLNEAIFTDFLQISPTFFQFSSGREKEVG